jgi:hypothetical protein
MRAAGGQERGAAGGHEPVIEIMGLTNRLLLIHNPMIQPITILITVLYDATNNNIQNRLL